MSTDRILNHLPALCNQIRRVAYEAGEITIKYFDESGFQGTQEKTDGSPVTVADIEAESLIVKELQEITPNTPIIGEELFSRGEAPDISENEYFWLVDALDGTKEFISGSGDYTVNIALIKGDEPILGVVYAPFHMEMYAGFEKNAVRWNDESRKDKDMRTRSMPRSGITVVASKSHGSGDQLDTFLQDFKVEKLIKKGSSLKICAIAAAKADVYPRFGPTCEWDIAAADAILRAAGGMITTMDKKPMKYKKDLRTLLNPEFIAWSGDLMKVAE